MGCGAFTFLLMQMLEAINEYQVYSHRPVQSTGKLRRQESKSMSHYSLVQLALASCDDNLREKKITYLLHSERLQVHFFPWTMFVYFVPCCVWTACTRPCTMIYTM